MCTAGPLPLPAWASVGHDAFLVEAAQLWGLNLRAVHPPAAACGLERAAEFRQHFDASYRPLVLRALEHGQPVLGWTGPRPIAEEGACTGPARWVLITHATTDGVGLAGLTPPRAKTCAGDSNGTAAPANAAGAGDAGQTFVFAEPPVQLYVVETVAATEAEPAQVLRVALRHAWALLHNELAGTLGLTTGPRCLDAWKEQAATTRGHACLAQHVVAGMRLGARFFRRHAASAGDEAPIVAMLGDICEETLVALEPLCDAHSADEPRATGAGPQAIQTARAAWHRALTALTARGVR